MRIPGKLPGIFFILLFELLLYVVVLNLFQDPAFVSYDSF
jgi:hypothetical protein